MTDGLKTHGDVCVFASSPCYFMDNLFNQKSQAPQTPHRLQNEILRGVESTAS